MAIMQPPSPTLSSLQPNPLGKRRFRPLRFVVWLAGAILIAAGLAWASTQVSERYAPMLLTPLGCGLLLGLLLALGMKAVGAGHRTSLLSGSLVAATVLAAGQHYFPYRAWKSQAPSGAAVIAAQAFPEVADRVSRRDASFIQYLRDEANPGKSLGSYELGPVGVWLFWGVSALAILVGTAVVIVPATRAPYCDRCGRWYQSLRFGAIDNQTARAIASLVNWGDIPHGDARFRLWGCTGGCEPDGCELSWLVSGRRAWIDRQTMNTIVKLIDLSAAAQQAFKAGGRPTANQNAQPTADARQTE